MDALVSIHCFDEKLYAVWYKWLYNIRLYLYCKTSGLDAPLAHKEKKNDLLGSALFSYRQK